MTERPRIAITAASEDAAKLCMDLIERSGGEPLLVLPEFDGSVDEALSGIGAVLVTGAEPPHTKNGKGDVHRESVEASLVVEAIRRDLPVLAVGNGMQVLNAVMGGKTVRTVPDHDVVDEDGAEKSSYHRIYISPGSKLAAIVGSGGFVRVNSRHSHGVKEAQKSPDLMASAYSLEDGVIEAMESPTHSLVLAIQFQPERRMEIPPHFERLFQLLVERAKTEEG